MRDRREFDLKRTGVFASPDPFDPWNGLGDGNTRGYQYGRNHSTGGTQESEGFSLGGFVRDTLTGAVIGGLGSAGFYGAGRAVEVLRGSVGWSKGGRDSEEVLHVYRGTDKYSEMATFKETGQLMSDATRGIYYETGNLNEAYIQSNTVHDSWLKIWGNENDYVQAHGAFGTELSEAFGLKRTFMSVTTDSNVARRFAGVNGRVYEAYIPKSQVIEQTLSGAGESEYLIKFGSGEFR